jgi:hypothetical protein
MYRCDPSCLASAQSFVRGIDNPLSVRLAFGEDDQEAQEMINSIMSWESLRQKIFASTEKRVVGLSGIARDLYQMSIQNYNFYRRVARSYSEMAQKLSLPRKPEFGTTKKEEKYPRDRDLETSGRTAHNLQF